MKKTRKILLLILSSVLIVISLCAFANFSVKAEHLSKPAKPPKIQKIHCKPLKPRRDGQERAYLLSNPCQTLYALDEIVENEEETSEVLGNLLATDLSYTYSQEEIQQAIDEASETFGEIENLNLPSNLTIQGDWGEGIVEVVTSKGFTRKFLVVFHKEDDGWRIFGTEEIEN